MKGNCHSPGSRLSSSFPFQLNLLPRHESKSAQPAAGKVWSPGFGRRGVRDHGEYEPSTRALDGTSRRPKPGLHAPAERSLDNQARFLKFMEGFKFQLSKKGGACAH